MVGTRPGPLRELPATAPHQRPAWRIVGASVPGTSHLRDTVGCQDASHWSQVDGTLALAIADGAGSAPHSQRGAHVAVESLVRAVAGMQAHLDLASRTNAALVRTLFGSVRRRIHREARRQGLPTKALASTLALALATPSKTLLAQVGDGIVVVERDRQDIAAVARTAKGEYANETAFLTSDGALDLISVDVVPSQEVTGIALLTDGLRMVALDRPATGNPHRPFFEDAFAFARSPTATSAAIERFLAKVNDGTGDDKTLVVAVRREDGQ